MMNNWKNKTLLGLFCMLFITTNVIFAAPSTITSPDGKLQTNFELNSAGEPIYSIKLNGKEVLRPSSLGLVRDDSDFTKKLNLDKTSSIEKVSDNYSMLLGKRKNCSYQANRCTFTLKNSSGQVMQIIFQVSNDGVAFRYAFPDDSSQTRTVIEEKTAFAFAPTTVSWLHPMQPGKTGWSRTQPSYEENYAVEKPVGEPSPTGVGWCLPALFKTSDNIWVLICDTDVNESYCAARLGQDSSGGIYKIAFPHPQEHRGPIDPCQPLITTPFNSPWRVLIIGQKLNTLVESTLMTDLATPSKIKNTDFIKPGKAAWHWLRYSDNSSTLDVAQSFLDFAANMKWQYILIDCNWDRSIGYETMAEFIKQAKSKNVGVILWYNSNGPWNDAPMSPKNRMYETSVRREEFAKLQQMGVKGVKVDFFPGDKQATMKFYLELLKDAADYNILVNCHGATIPRGWQRTWPNLVTMEAVKGMEYCTFEQRNADLEPQHCCILPFTRNVIGSMDFTPVVFNPRIRGVNLRTTLAFELALSVVFESGVQHFGLVPDEYKLMPDYVVKFLQDVPTVWDETRLIDGYPGNFAVIARKSGSKWYIAGLNGTKQEKELTLDLSFLPAQTTAALITDGPASVDAETGRPQRSFNQSTLNKYTIRKPNIKLQPNGGFVIITD
jgi:alpha-glucosidase